MVETSGSRRVQDAFDLENAKRIIASLKDPHLAVKHMLREMIPAEIAADALFGQGVQAQVFEGRITGQVEVDLGLGDKVGGVTTGYVQEKVPMLVFWVRDCAGKLEPLVMPWVLVVDPSSNEPTK